MVINVLIERKMKKEYIYPEMEVVEINAPQLLAGSPDPNPSNEEPSEYGAPELNMFGF